MRCKPRIISNFRFWLYKLNGQYFYRKVLIKYDAPFMTFSTNTEGF